MVENYRVGQVLFVIPSDNALVVPVQITERRISETSSGTVVKHIVKSAKAKAPPMVLETIKGTIFPDLRSAREMMIRNATGAIDGMIKHASSVAQQAFAPPKQSVVNDADEFDPLSSADVFVDDVEMQGPAPDDGQFLPTPSQTPQVTQQRPSLSHSDVVSDDGTTEIMLPDGKKQRVRLKMT